MKKKVIIITDGDNVAKQAIEIAAKKIGGRCISLSAGNPSIISSDTLITLINSAKNDPVLVMVDDKGKRGYGSGESVMMHLILSDEIIVMGIIAVASNTNFGSPVQVNCSINNKGQIVRNAVDKYGDEIDSDNLIGDTINCLHKIKLPYVVGIGDIGKIRGSDDIEIGVPILIEAIKQVLHNFNSKSTLQHS